ncbi:N-lysine methyltransferase KMT5A-like [Dendronephthya gigantea]|uniref:N-lysine methyltransferase KMT5A-like n=1 Tax=Dendronephthya gigantea TaxID=151771 RepID=UPI00106AE19B|nr:N-lysine methyltransferase KMT5A-like [Dendronephthya gigantea]
MADQKEARSSLRIKRQKEPNEETLPEDSKDLEQRYINNIIGDGVFAKRKFQKGEFLLEYKGELIGKDEGARREEAYVKELGSFLFFFDSLCVDATFSTGLGRMVNDSEMKLANCLIKKVIVDSRPHLALFAKKKILKHEELRYDYGVKNLPWRRIKELCKRKPRNYFGEVMKKINEGIPQSNTACHRDCIIDEFETRNWEMHGHGEEYHCTVFMFACINVIFFRL